MDAFDPEAPPEATRKRKSKWGAGTAAGSFDTSVGSVAAPIWKPPDPNAPKPPPPAPPKPKKMEWENEDHFILDMKLDYEAESAFRQLNMVQRQKVMDLGEFAVSTDISKQCLSRIKYVQEKEVNEKATAFKEQQERLAREQKIIEKIGPNVRQVPESGGSYEDFDTATAIFKQQVEIFVKDNYLDEGAASKLRMANEDVQQKVMSFGNIVGSDNPSSACLQRIRNAELAILGEQGIQAEREASNLQSMFKQNFAAIDNKPENKFTPY